MLHPCEGGVSDASGLVCTRRSIPFVSFGTVMLVYPFLMCPPPLLSPQLLLQNEHKTSSSSMQEHLRTAGLKLQLMLRYYLWYHLDVPWLPTPPLPLWPRRSAMENTTLSVRPSVPTPFQCPREDHSYFFSERLRPVDAHTARSGNRQPSRRRSA